VHHTSNKCPLPCNEAKITKAKEVCAKLVTEGCDSGGCGPGHRHGDDCVAMGVTIPILGESGVPIKVILLLLVQIHCRVMELISKMESG
jgi:hypothetical protein